MGQVDLSRHYVKILIRQLEGVALLQWMNEMVTKWSKEKFIFHAIIPHKS